MYMWCLNQLLFSSSTKWHHTLSIKKTFEVEAKYSYESALLHTIHKICLPWTHFENSRFQYDNFHGKNRWWYLHLNLLHITIKTYLMNLGECESDDFSTNAINNIQSTWKWHLSISISTKSTWWIFKEEKATQNLFRQQVLNRNINANYFQTLRDCRMRIRVDCLTMSSIFPFGSWVSYKYFFRHLETKVLTHSHSHMWKECETPKSLHHYVTQINTFSQNEPNMAYHFHIRNMLNTAATVP